jgi:Protein of unknown function (DUF3558)
MTTRLQRRTIVLTTALTLLLGACSSASTPAPAAATSGAPSAATGQPSIPPAVGPTGAATGGTGDPCSLLTQAEVDTAAGQPLGPGAQAGALDDCQWSNSDFSGSVELEVGDWTAIKAESLGSGATLTAVPGVGDEAWTFNAAGNAAQLYVRKGTTGFKLLLGGGQYIGSLADLGLAQEKALAAAVLGRL